MSDSSITLETITEVQEGSDAHIRAHKLPIITGQHEGDLNCGHCGQAIAKGTTPAEFHAKVQTDQRLVVECTCGALNLVPRAH